MQVDPAVWWHVTANGNIEYLVSTAYTCNCRYNDEM